MNDQTPISYPGETATPQEMLGLANHYRLAFDTLRKQKDGKAKTLIAPANLCAIHGIELYLQALLRLDGTAHSTIRGYQHELAEMAAQPSVVDLKLGQRTRAHLQSMTEQREYLIVRYAPDMTDARSELTRLAATLKELAEKVGHRFDAQNAPTPSGS
ncbi:MAG: hypothetical protein AAGM21_13675 [Pseudomonadota bacterium]